MREMTIRAGERTRVIRTFSSSIPRRYTLTVDGSGSVSGTVEVCGSRWLFSKPPEVLDLQQVTTVHRGFWDTRFSVYVTPDRDIQITIR